MGCKSFINIKSKNPYNVKFTWIPCGHCEDCRKAMKSEWTTRLKSEIEYYHTNLNYKLGFITLTYNEQHLPKIPKTFFKKDEYKEIPCFSYLDIKKFTDTIRTYLWRTYHLNDGFRYFITSEYGEQKHRPHYHGIILFNPKISHEIMYKICQDAWTGSTELIPNNKKSPRKNHGIIAPFDTFIPRDNYATGAYVAKYVCKDLEFANTTNGLFNHLTKKQKNHLRHFMPFHKQSMGFGACILKNKTDKQLEEFFKNGIAFTGNPKLIELPRYIKNKLLYTNHRKYNLNTHKFETIKQYTKFFYEHKNLIYDKKFKENVKLIEEYGKDEHWKNNPIKPDVFHNVVNQETGEYWETYTINHTENAIKLCKDIINWAGIGELAYFYTLYYGVPYENCKFFKNPSDAIFARYNPCADLTNLPDLNKEYYDNMHNALHMMFAYKSWVDTVPRNDRDAMIAELRAFYNA